MKRKVIQIAGSTHLVSLPKDWVKRVGVKKGEEVDVEEQGSKVIISTEKSNAPSAITLSHERFGKFHPNFLSAAYHMGYEDVEVIYDDETTLAKVQERLSNCIGYEILNQGDNFCRIKSISQVSLTEFDQMLRKVFLLLMTMGNNMLEVLEEGKYPKLKEVMILEVTNNKLTDFCKRVLNVRGYKEHNKLTIIYVMITHLEMIADEYRDICEAMMDKKTKLSPGILEDVKDVNIMFNDLYDSFYKFEKTKIESVFKKAKPLRTRLLEKLLKAKPEERIVLHSLANIVSEVYEMATENLEFNM